MVSKRYRFIQKRINESKGVNEQGLPGLQLLAGDAGIDDYKSTPDTSGGQQT